MNHKTIKRILENTMKINNLIINPINIEMNNIKRKITINIKNIILMMIANTHKNLHLINIYNLMKKRNQIKIIEIIKITIIIIIIIITIKKDHIKEILSKRVINM